MSSRALSSALTPFQQAAIARSLPSHGAAGILFNTIVGIEGRHFAVTAARPLGEGDWESAFSAVVARRAYARVDRLLPIVATGCHDGYHWIAYETGHARPLVADGWRRWPAQLAIDLVSDIGNALDDAAAFGIVPYELLPSSIFMDTRLGPLLGDLGAAREVIGSPPADDDPGRAFTPPEVIAGGIAGARSGVYVCGALLYALLSGGPPRHDPLTRWRADLATEIDLVLARAMAPDTLERYRSVTEFCESARSAMHLAPAADTRGAAAIDTPAESEQPTKRDAAAPWVFGAEQPAERAAFEPQAAEPMQPTGRDAFEPIAAEPEPPVRRDAPAPWVFGAEQPAERAAFEPQAAEPAQVAEPAQRAEPSVAARPEAGERGRFEPLAAGPAEPAVDDPAALRSPVDERALNGELVPADELVFRPAGEADFQPIPEPPDDYALRPPLPPAARRLALVLATGLVAAAGVVGYQLAQPDPPARAAGAEVAGEGVRITLPAGWSLGEARGRELLAAYPTVDWLAGLTIRAGEKAAAVQTRSDPVRLGNLDMWRDATDAPRIVRYVLPTSTGSLRIACEATPTAAQATLAACERSLSTLSLDEAKPLRLAGVARKPGLRAAVERLRRDRLAGRAALARARTPGAQRAAALRLERANSRASQRLEKLPDTDALAASAGDAADAYAALARLAGSGKRAAWHKALTRVRGAEVALADELAKQG